MDVPTGSAVFVAWSSWRSMVTGKRRCRKCSARPLRSISAVVLTALVVFCGCADTRPIRHAPRTADEAARNAQAPLGDEMSAAPPKATSVRDLAQATATAGEPPVPPPIRPSNADEAQPATNALPPKADNSWKSAPTANENLAAVRKTVDGCLAFLEQNPKYTVRVSRQEKVGNRVLPAEVMLMHFRLQPRSVYYKWLDDGNAGRAVLFVEGQNDGMIISHGGKGDFLLAGRTLRVDPNGFLARSKSRYSITESGLDNMVRRLEVVVALLERGNQSRGTVEFLGEGKHEGVDDKLLVIRQQIPVGADPFVPKGGIRHWYFDAATLRLAIMHGDEFDGSFFEHYVFDRFVPNPALTDGDFDPELLFPGKKSASSGWRAPASAGTASRNVELPK